MSWTDSPMFSGSNPFTERSQNISLCTCCSNICCSTILGIIKARSATLNVEFIELQTFDCSYRAASSRGKPNCSEQEQECCHCEFISNSKREQNQNTETDKNSTATQNTPPTHLTAFQSISCSRIQCHFISFPSLPWPFYCWMQAGCVTASALGKHSRKNSMTTNLNTSWTESPLGFGFLLVIYFMAFSLFHMCVWVYMFVC